MAEVKELKDAISTQMLELEQLQGYSAEQQEEINNGRQYSQPNTDIEEIIREFGSS